MPNRRRCVECDELQPSKCLPFLHSYEPVDDPPHGHGHRKVRCTRCGYEKIEKHFGRGVWL